MLWTAGNYSRFIRPGALRFEANLVGFQQQENTPVLVSAYKDELAKKLIAVIVNPTNDAVNLELNVCGGKVAVNESYTTSVDMDLKAAQLHSAQRLLIPPRCITTVVSSIL